MDINKSELEGDETKIMPCTCPSCAKGLKVSRMVCPACGTAVEGDFGLPLLARLDVEDQQFVAHFIRSSGSLKELAKIYHVSYPTVRNRLDALIEKLSTLGRSGPGD
jgi:hypothetical protein